MANQEAIRDAVAEAPLIRRVSKLTDHWLPCNREAGIKPIDGDTLEIHLHVNNADNGKRLLESMVSSVREAVQAADPSLTTHLQARESPHRRVIIVTYQTTSEGRDATTEAQTSDGREGRDNARNGRRSRGG